MIKTEFKNKIFLNVLIGLILVLLAWNLFWSIAYKEILGLLPIILQTILLILILKRSRYAKIGIKLWASIFFILGFGLQLFGRLLQDLSNGLGNADVSTYLTKGSIIIIGVFILIFCKTIHVIKYEEKRTLGRLIGDSV